MPRRPPGLEALGKPTEPTIDQKLSVTDTMTLVVGDDSGSKIHVKQDGVRHDLASASASSMTGSESQLNGSIPCMDKSSLPKSILGSGGFAFEELKVFKEKIGSGAQGSVRRVLHRTTGEQYALKSITFGDDKEATRATLMRELKRVTVLDHPCIVSSYEAYYREGRLMILMEFLDLGTVAQVIKRHAKLKEKSPCKGMPVACVRYIASKLFEGLALLHESQVIHRDIKPSNLLVSTKGEVKISDFGLATHDTKRQHQTEVGSTPYMSPERIQSKPYSYGCDVWAAGMVVAELALGSYAFGSEIKGSVFELCQLIGSHQGKVQWTPGVTFDPTMIDLVARCLLPVESRPSAKDLQEHPFLQSSGSHDPQEALRMGKWFANPCDDNTAHKEVSSNRSSGHLPEHDEMSISPQ